MKHKPKWICTKLYGDADKSQPHGLDDLTAVSFDYKGNYLTIGDKKGRIAIFEKSINKDKFKSCDYTCITENMASEIEYDAFTSQRLEPKITCIEWLNRSLELPFFLTSNEKNIKLWKMFQKVEGNYYNFNNGNNKQIKFPKKKPIGRSTSLYSKPYTCVHKYLINSLSASKINQNFLSSDYCSIYIWDVNITDRSYKYIDFEKEALHNEESISNAKFSPVQTDILAYGTEKGKVRLCDLRVNSCHYQATIDFKSREEYEFSTFMMSGINSISDVQFTNDGKYIMSRDCMSIKIWDLRVSAKPFNQIMTEKFLETMSFDSIDLGMCDRFKLSTSPDSKEYCTGTYNCCFVIGDIEGKCQKSYEPNYGFNKGKGSHSFLDSSCGLNSSLFKDTSHKLECVAWHPIDRTVAVSVQNCFYIFNEVA